MRVEVLHVPGCPRLEPLLQQLRRVTDVSITVREICTAAEAADAGMSGSPTLLINGVDPFLEVGAADSGVACRLYRDEYGAIVPVPSVTQLRAAIAENRRRRSTR